VNVKVILTSFKMCALQIFVGSCILATNFLILIHRVQKAVVYLKKSVQLLCFVILYSLSQAYILLKETGRKKGQVNDSVT